MVLQCDVAKVCGNGMKKICERQYLADQLTKSINYNYKLLVAFVLIGGLLLCVIGYCAYEIYKVISFYKIQNKNLKERQLYMSKNFPVDHSSSDNDNEVYMKEKQEMSKPGYDAETRISDDDFFRMNIEQRIQAYKAYNEKMRSYYKQNRPDQVPEDIIDRDIFDREKDNYGSTQGLDEGEKANYVFP